MDINVKDAKTAYVPIDTEREKLLKKKRKSQPQRGMFS